jgi:putative transposase
LRTVHRFSCSLVFTALFASLWASFRNRAALQFEIVALRHQLGVLHRSVKRPRLNAADRLFWAWLSQMWSDWRTALVIVKPETVIAWHRRGFRLFWTWKVGRAVPVGLPWRRRSVI